MKLPDHDKTNDRPSGDLGPSQASGIDPSTGAALRSVYQRTVEETIPDEMLDLLSKLD